MKKTMKKTMKGGAWPSSRLYYTNIFGAFLLAIFSSDVESLKQGIVMTSKDKVQADYTILLVGETGVGKSTFLEFLANVLIGNDIDRYDFEVLDLSNERSGPHKHGPTQSAHLYKFTSKNGVVVSAGVLSIVSTCNLFPRFASSTHLG